MHRQDSLTFPLLIVSILRSHKSQTVFAISIAVILPGGALTDLQQISKDPAIKKHTFPHLLRRLHKLSSKHRSKSLWTNDEAALLSVLPATATIVQKKGST